MVIHAAALSSPPDDEDCVRAAIVTSWRGPDPGSVAILPPRRRCVALWRKHWTRAEHIVHPDDDDDTLDVVDILHSHENGGVFLFLTQGEHIRACTPIRLEDNELTANWHTERFRPRRRRFYDQFVRNRYLLDTSETLLMVVRFTPEPNQPTSRFKVIMLDGREEHDADADANFPVDRYAWSWSELDTLGGLLLFIRHGCSRSYQVDQYPGLKSGIYFLDDGEFYNESVYSATAICSFLCFRGTQVPSQQSQLDKQKHSCTGSCLSPCLRKLPEGKRIRISPTASNAFVSNPHFATATPTSSSVLSRLPASHPIPMAALTPPPRSWAGLPSAYLLFLHFRETGRHQLLNVRTGGVRDLPGALDNMLVVAAALSSPLGFSSCVAAAIVAPA
ncbi:hypothetical protein BAE44_0024452 [Dichanthelium oligosanthes]|uniref:KIB1-4 beta-propeller domain-containing protein n=1 Tax=Dichanthelium oligosanthes TaxID=888268 RepID=A0A1E5UNS5_9POAL|nr:hypothetical protein BAE44_0024452 [Dichanthelium oligosanthes]